MLSGFRSLLIAELSCCESSLLSFVKTSRERDGMPLPTAILSWPLLGTLLELEPRQCRILRCQLYHSLSHRHY